MHRVRRPVGARKEEGKKKPLGTEAASLLVMRMLHNLTSAGSAFSGG